MNNPFHNRNLSLNGPARDIMPITPDDAVDLSEVAVALYVETGGSVVFVSTEGQTRTVNMADFSILPVGTVRVMATGTTASGIHAMVIS